MVPAVAIAATAILSGCSQMTWDEKLEALRIAGERGADTHYVLLTENKEPTRDNCAKNYSLAMGAGENPPAETDSGSSDEWRKLHLDYFIDSCVSGKPRKPRTRPTSTSSTATATT